MGYPRCKELSQDERKRLKNLDNDKLREGLDIQATHKSLTSRMCNYSIKKEESHAIMDNQLQIQNLKNAELQKAQSTLNR